MDTTFVLKETIKLALPAPAFSEDSSLRSSIASQFLSRFFTIILYLSFAGLTAP